MERVWHRKWVWPGTALFYLNRYLPLIDELLIILCAPALVIWFGTLWNYANFSTDRGGGQGIGEGMSSQLWHDTL